MTRTMTISDAVDRYLDERKDDVSDSTLYNHTSNLRQFIEWCDGDSDKPAVINNIDGWHVSDFKMDRRDEDIADTTLYNQMSALRVFIQWCESRDLVEGISENIIMPNIEDGARDDVLEPERAEQLLEELQKYEYASLKHALFGLLWSTGMRVGTARALDVDDYNSVEMYVKVRHRPEERTPLKNKASAERQVNLHEWFCDILDDYIEGRRNDVTDDHGREPLFTTSQGRAHRTTLRKHVTTMTRPCQFSNSCPHDRDIETCEATEYTKASRCPGSVSPHPLRRSAITNSLNDGHSKELISDRMDVSVDVLDKHYDARSESDKRELRREMFEMD